MILAQNHRRQLNGNKNIALVFLATLLFSCGALRKTTVPEKEVDTETPTEIVVVPNEGDGIPDNEEKDDEVEEVTVYESVSFKGFDFKVPVHKKNFNIAVMLPFHLNGAKSAADRARAAYMLEYYQGIKLAISEIESLGSKFTISIYDTENDTSVLKQLLRKPAVDKADLIIGPTDEAQLRMAAYFGKKRSIPVFSPMSILDKTWSENLFYYNLSPSHSMQAKAYIQYFKKNFSKHQLIIIRDGGRFDKSFGKALIDQLKKTKISHRVIAYNSSINWSTYIPAEGEVVVLHTSTSKTKMSYTVNSLLHKAKQVTLMGPDNWMDFNNVDFSFWERLNISFISTNLSQAPNSMSKDVVSRFTDSYKGYPSKYTFKGHDHILFAAELLNAFGPYFPMFIQNKAFSYSNVTFKFVVDGNCFQNEFLQIFEFKEGEIIPTKMN